METLTQPIKVFGGKFFLAKRIVSMMPRHIAYVEPYFGGGAVLLARDPADESLWADGHKGVSEVCNDIHHSLFVFWKVLQDERMFGRFLRKVEATPFSEAEFDRTFWVTSVTDPTREDDWLDIAFAFFVRARQSLSGMGKSFTGITKTRVRRGMSNEVSAWLTAVEGLPAVHDRLKRVLILNRDALDVIRGQDNSDCFMYIDPSYVHSTRTAPDVYKHECSDDHHRELLEILGSLKGKFILSGYPSAMYDEAIEKHGWHREDFDLPNNAAGGDTKRRMTEMLVTNYEVMR